MLKLKRLLIVAILMILIIGFGGNYSEAYNQNNSIKSIWSIDTNLDGAIYKENGLNIEGWILATQANNRLEVYINEKKLDDKYIKYSRKYDLTSIIQGYGTYKENPLPNFDIHIPIEDFEIGKYDLKILHVTENGQILQAMEKQICVTRYIKHVLCVDTNLQGRVFDKNGIQIEGWRLATEANTKLEIKIDGVPAEFSQEDKRLYDLISIIQGYGTYKENPLPNYKVTIPTENLTDGKHKIQINFLTSDGIVLETYESQITIEKIRHMLNVDTKLQGQTFDKYGIEIEGWRLATEPNTKLQIEIDGLPVEFTQEDKILYDLISIIQGYGTYKENPLPNFKIKIPTTNILEGKHKLTIKFMTANGEILEKNEYGIIIDKSIKHFLCIDTQLENTAWYPNGIQINGWKTATEPNTKLDIFIDDRKLENLDMQSGYYYDLFSIIKGYGTYEDNPNPIFTINIPVTEFSASNHTLKIQFTTEGGTLLEEVQYNLVQHKTWIRIESLTDRGSIFNEEQKISGWAMTTMPGTELRLLIDGLYRDESVIRGHRQDVLDAIHGFGGVENNPLPGYCFNVDFSKINFGMHQIVVRVQKGGTVLDELIYYIFVNPKPRFEQGIYGKSGLAVSGDSRGSDLIYYRIGTGPNVLFATFGLHGFEDKWDKDGAELTYIAEQFKKTLLSNQDQELEKEWTIYILPCLNPDGQKYGWTEDGPGRTTLYSAAPGNKGVDINRCWSTDFVAQENDRNYTGSEPFLAYEARYLRNFLLENRSKTGQTVLVDLHGWLNQTIGDEEIGKYYKQQLGITKPHTYTYGQGYLVAWAKENLGNNNYEARSSLIELIPVSSHSQVVSKKYAEKYITATINMLKCII